MNILLYHGLMDPAGLPPGVVAFALWLVVFYQHRTAFTGLFAMRQAEEATPHANRN